jgi:hypothetical protein
VHSDCGSPHCESFGAMLGKPIVEFTLYGPACILEEAKLLGEVVAVSVWRRRSKGG